MRVIILLLLWASAFSAGVMNPANPTFIYLYEGFDSGTLPLGWNVQQVFGSAASWTVTGVGTNPPVAPYSGTGQAQFNSYDALDGEQARLVTRAVDLSSAVVPVLKFAMYHDDELLENTDSIYVEVSIADSIQGPWTMLSGFARPRRIPGWSNEALPLFPAKGYSRVFIAFRGVSNYGNNIYIDEIEVVDSSFHDIGATSLINPGDITVGPHPESSSTSSRGRYPILRKSGVTRMPVVAVETRIGQDTTLGVIIRNFGTFDEQSYQVNWSVDGIARPPVSNHRELVKVSLDTIALPWVGVAPGRHFVAAWTSLASDSNALNDTAAINVEVLDSSVVFYESFNGTVFPPAGWSTINADVGVLDPWFRGSANSAFPPFEGAGFAADNFQRANGKYLDDYLVSPLLQNVGRATNYDSLVFWVRSNLNPPPEINYPDSLMILLAITGFDTSTITTTLDYFSVPKGTWARKGYLLTGIPPPELRCAAVVPVSSL